MGWLFVEQLGIWQSGSEARRLFSIYVKEQFMSINKYQVKGRVEEAKGKVKEVAGKLVGNEKLEVKGIAQKIAGEAQAKFGDIKHDLKKGI